MASVTQRIKEISQPRGGYLNPKIFKEIPLDDNEELNPEENIHGSVVGMAVDYLSRFMTGAEPAEAFKISLAGANMATMLGIKNANSIADKLLSKIKGLDDDSIINACKLVTFDVWFRNTPAALYAKNYADTNPDKETIENIRIMVKRAEKFFETFGLPVVDGFTFEPEGLTPSDWKESNSNSFGGYTKTVDSGDGDFLTKDTLWDFKVSKSKPTSKHTLQLLMYWIMGQHSLKPMYVPITKIGFYNPRFSTVYILDISSVPQEIIKEVEEKVICY